MYLLYHHPICPFSRKVRFAMTEKDVDFSLKIEKFWEKRENFLKLNPMGTVPFLLAKPKINIIGSQNIIDYFEEINSLNPLVTGSALQKCEIRRIILWFDEKFYNDISKTILHEKVFKFFKKSSPNQSLLKIARANLLQHMNYLHYLLSKNQWISGNKINLSDFTAAAHLSSLDYLGEIEWERYSLIKEWYAIIKSRPSFQAIIQDTVSGFPCAPHYKDLDF